MHKAAQVGIALSEETLTETVLYEIAFAHKGTHEIGVRLATKPAENRHGADWEWWLVKNGKGVGFRVQAKRLFANGTFQSLLKPSPKDPYEQLSKLVNAAAKDGRVPLYCFFNFEHHSIKFGSGGHCKHSYRRPSYWGCTLALPQEVKAAASNSLKDLRTIMQPWHMLVCDSHSRDLPETGISFIRDTFTRARLRHPSIQMPQFEGLRGPIPDYVARLMDLSKEQARIERAFLDYSYWEQIGGAPDDIAGLAVFDDARE
jgi:hypothetical protein